MSFLKTTAIQHLNASAPSIGLTSDGKVGIGTINPQYKFDVQNNTNGLARFMFSNSDTTTWQQTDLAIGRAGSPNFLYIGTNYLNTQQSFIDDRSGGFLSFRSEGTETMRIDSSGRVTKPYQPYFLAGSNQGSHTITDSNLLDFNVSVINNGNYYNTSTYAFTAPVTGLYQFYFQVYVQNGASQKSIAWKKNGSQYTISDTAIAFQGPTNISDFTLNSSMLFYLNANDYIQTCVRQGSGNLQWYSGHSWFWGYLIG